MFDSLSEKLGKTLRNLRGVGKLSEENVSEALGEVRKALLSADVHFRTAREFVEEVKNACLGQEVLKSVSPGQQVVKIIHDELVKLLGEGTTRLSEDRPLRVLMVGLHGAGKTTTSAKLARRMAKDGRSPMLVACDTPSTMPHRLAPLPRCAAITRPPCTCGETTVLELEYAPDPSQIVEWVTEAYSATDRLMSAVDLRN